ncbi:MAG: hypothetical protein KF686_07515 [Ramlibacter sp.]|nr:hypothetical protein [Ramlibacter sp.]
MPHRFTSIYRPDKAPLRSAVLVGKVHDFDATAILEIQLSDSFCHFVMHEGSFIAMDTAHDDRLEGHAYKGMVNS